MPHDNLFGLYWTEEVIHTLGVSLSGDENDHYILNYKKRLKNMKNLLSSWKCRRLSLKGKVTVINTLAVSPFLYLASVIHVPVQVIQDVKKLVVDFIWDSKPPKVAYDVMIQSIENGGFKLVDFESKVKSPKRGFIKRLLQNKTGKWRSTAANFKKLVIWIIISNVIKSQLILETNSMKKHSIIGANFKKSELQP